MTGPRAYTRAAGRGAEDSAARLAEAAGEGGEHSTLDCHSSVCVPWFPPKSLLTFFLNLRNPIGRRGLVLRA